MGTGRPSDSPGDWIGRWLRVEIDRPLGSRHPRFPRTVYAANYGFVPGTHAADGAEVDAYVLGIDRPLTRFEGRCIAILRRGTDVEDKLVVAPDGFGPDDDAILAAVDFVERFFGPAVIR